MKHLAALLFLAATLFSSEAFISSTELKSKLKQDNVVIIDTTDMETFNKGHIPGAIQVDISKFRHSVETYQLMNSSTEIQNLARSLGINNDAEVIIYGHNKGKELLKASYIALSFITNGLNKVSILNGGYEDWLYEFGKEKDAISTKTVTPKTGDFVAKFNPNILVDLDYVKAHIGTTPMIEARPIQFFNGTVQSQGVKRLGHIAKAHSSNWRDKFNPDDTLVTDQELNDIYVNNNGLNPDKEVIAYCTGGLEASMNWYILTQHLHYKDVKIYDASMRQWGNLDDTPMEK